MVDCVVGGVKAFFTYLWTSDVLPTPWLPSTTILRRRSASTAGRAGLGGEGEGEGADSGQRTARWRCGSRGRQRTASNAARRPMAWRVVAGVRGRRRSHGG
jgi:hypothetical protein